jgi:hypothetical protein
MAYMEQPNVAIKSSVATMERGKGPGAEFDMDQSPTQRFALGNSPDGSLKSSQVAPVGWV